MSSQEHFAVEVADVAVLPAQRLARFESAIARAATSLTVPPAAAICDCVIVDKTRGRN